MRAATSSVKCSCKSAAFTATDADATAPIAHSTRAAPSVPGPIDAAAAQRRLRRSNEGSNQLRSQCAALPALRSDSLATACQSRSNEGSNQLLTAAASPLHSLPSTQMRMRQSHTAQEQLLRCQDRLARLRHNAGSTQMQPFSSMSVLTAAAIGPPIAHSTRAATSTVRSVAARSDCMSEQVE